MVVSKYNPEVFSPFTLQLEDSPFSISQERIIREIKVSGTETTRPSCSYNAKDAIYFILFQIHSQPHTRSDYTREERGERVSIRLSQVSFSFQCRQVLLLTSINSSRPNYILMIIEKVHLLLF